MATAFSFYKFLKKVKLEENDKNLFAYKSFENTAQDGVRLFIRALWYYRTLKSSEYLLQGLITMKTLLS